MLIKNGDRAIILEDVRGMKGKRCIVQNAINKIVTGKDGKYYYIPAYYCVSISSTAQRFRQWIVIAADKLERL